MSESREPVDPPIIPKGLLTKLFVVAVAYMVLMQVLPAPTGADMSNVWFVTALPVAWLLGSLWHWFTRPEPRRSLGEVIGIWRCAVLRAPGMSTFYAGMIPVLGVFAMTQEIDLPNIMVAVLIPVAIIVGLVARAKRARNGKGPGTV